MFLSKNLHQGLRNPIILTLALIVSVFVGAIAGQQTQVEAKTVSEMSAKEEAQSLSYYQVLGQCVGNNMKGTIDLQPRDNGNALPVTWFDANTASGNVFTERGIECRNIADKALALWGWGTNGGQFLKDMGYTWDANAPAYRGPGGIGFSEERRNNFFNLIKSRVYNGNNPSLSQKAQYEMYFQAAKSEPCSMKDLGLYDNLNESYKAWVDSNHEEQDSNGTVQYRKVTLVGADNKALEHGISFVSKTASDAVEVPTSYNSYGYRAGGSNVGGLTLDCAAYVNGIGQAAGAYARYADATKTTPPGAGTDTSTNPEEGTERTSCKPEGIGWILCPISNAIAKMTDGLFDLVKELLRVEPILGSEDYQKNLQTAWGTMRNFANVAFVIAFMFIIFSQTTSIGLTNYGIKRMLPRLIIAAVLVNLSFYICAILVDLSNIIGIALQDLLMNLRGSAVNGSDPDVWSNLASSVLAGTALTAGAVVYTVIAAPATLWAAVASLVIVLIPAILALLTAFLVLIFRQALIIVLIILSPLAFVAYILPNTESWYKKWQTVFVAMLVFFPLMSLVFGGSQLAASFIMASAKTDTMVGFFMYVGALAVQVVPLFIAPVLLKLSGGILNRFAGIVNNPNRGPVDAIKKRIGESRDLANKKGLAGNNVFGGIARRREFGRRKRELLGKRYDAQSDAGWQERIATDGSPLAGINNEALAQAAREGEAKVVQRENYSRALDTNATLLRTAAGLGEERAETKIKAAIQSAKVEDFNKNVSAEKKTMSTFNPDQLNTIMRDTNLSSERRAAAAGLRVSTGSDGDIHDTLEYLGTQARGADGKFTDQAISDIQQQVGGDMGSRKPIVLGAGDVSNLNRGQYTGTFESKIHSRLTAGKLSAQGMASATTDDLDKIMGYIQTNRASLMADSTSAEALKALEHDIAEFRTSPQLQGQQPAHEIASRLDKIHGIISS